MYGGNLNQRLTCQDTVLYNALCNVHQRLKTRIKLDDQVKNRKNRNHNLGAIINIPLPPSCFSYTVYSNHNVLHLHTLLRGTVTHLKIHTYHSNKYDITTKPLLYTNIFTLYFVA